MKSDIILYNAETNKDYFKLSHGIRTWGILLMISKGRFKLHFPTLNKTDIVSSGEIAYMPPNIEFYREIIENIDFHQITFLSLDNDIRLSSLKAGKLNIPREQVMSIINSANKILDFPASQNLLVQHIIDRIVTENYLFLHTVSIPHASDDLCLITSYITEHLSDELSLFDMAAKIHLSQNGLIWKFKNELKVTPMKYVAICRMNRAKQLLFESEMTVSEISEACGYANEYYFSNAFKKFEGISPSEFRKKCNKQ